MTTSASSRSPPPDAPTITPMKASLDRSGGDSVVAERRDEIYFYNERASHAFHTVINVQFHMPNISKVES